MKGRVWSQGEGATVSDVEAAETPWSVLRASQHVQKIHLGSRLRLRLTELLRCRLS